MYMSNKGKLVLIPNVISENSEDLVLPRQIMEVLPGITHFLVENVRTARRFLSRLKLYPSIEALQFDVLDKDTSPDLMPDLFKPVFEGLNLGVISESGCPGVADPGALAVSFAHAQGIDVMPLVGPSSILLALMSSGLNGQRFCFHGYLPIEKADASKVISDLEKESRIRQQTQIFIETPYRNNSLLASLLKSLSAATRLCVAIDLTGAEQSILCKPIEDWRKKSLTLPKKPAIFLFLA
jgi:16S rRNA (cytidine1402-2'-O)-methyltransferase